MSAQGATESRSVLASRVSTKLEIQDVALNLFDSGGFDEVSVEQVASSAGISPRSLYRYFGTKEQLVVWDPMDARLVDNLAGLVETSHTVHQFVDAALSGFSGLVRNTMSPADAERLERRLRLIRSVPTLRAGELKQMEFLAQSLYTVLSDAPFTHRHAPAQVRLAAYHVAWGLLAVADDWAAHDFTGPFAAALDSSFPMMIRSVAAALEAKP